MSKSNRLTIPRGEIRDGLDRRRQEEDDPAVRTHAQRDRDRILYSSAFLRLGHVSQVTAPEAGHIFHSRLTHSLKVAQFARRLAERLKRDLAAGELTGAAAEIVEALDVDAAEAAALAHDLGHPPFGHLAETELQDLARASGSFEGNAQSFRIVTRLARRSTEAAGLNLTRRTLNGLLKYPCLRYTDDGDPNEKWGAYDMDRSYFAWVREGLPDGERTLEAEIMDWADDVTYAVHDMDDFYRAGLIPLDRLFQADEELAEFQQHLGRRHPGAAEELSSVAERLLRGFLPFTSPYRGRTADRANLRGIGSLLITRYMGAVSLASGDDETVSFEVSESLRREVAVLKELTWFYIIDRPSLATIQSGQRQVIRRLFELYVKAAEARELRLFPPPIAERIEQASDEANRVRAVVDLIAGMTEMSALETYRRAIGTSSGSILTSAGDPC